MLQTLESASCGHAVVDRSARPKTHLCRQGVPRQEGRRLPPPLAVTHTSQAPTSIGFQHQGHEENATSSRAVLLHVLPCRRHRSPRKGLEGLPCVAIAVPTVMGRPRPAVEHFPYVPAKDGHVLVCQRLDHLSNQIDGPNPVTSAKLRHRPRLLQERCWDLVQTLHVASS